VSKLNRRSFLRGAGAFGAASLALPALPSISKAAPGDFPKRLVVFFSGNGTIGPNWKPESTNGRLTGLSTILEPLRPHMQDITVIEGLDIECARTAWQPRGGFHAHERGLGGILTGTHLNTGSMEANSGYANGISVDQFIADGLGDQTALHSLQVGILSSRHGNGWYNRDTMVYAGANQPKFHERDGARLFAQIFGDDPGESAAYARIRQRRRSVLDFLKSDLARVERRLSAADRQRVAQHTQAFRDLERQLDEVVACEAPDGPGGINFTSQAQTGTIADFQIRQTVQALACDRTRVATIQFGKGLGALSLQCIGMSDSWHALSHEGDNNADAQSKLTQLNTYIAARFADLLTQMKSVREGDGTMLDNSVVLWVNELGKGNNHNHHDVPIVMAGRAGGFFKPGGRHVEYDRRNTNDLLVTLCRAFGHHDVDRFGIPELNEGVLSELIA
jgi:hypothetical protein